MPRCRFVGMFLMVATLAVQAQDGSQPNAQPLWLCPLRAGAVPERLVPNGPPVRATSAVALCRDGMSMVVIPEGAPVPRAIPRGSRVVVCVKAPDGRPAAGVDVEWKPEGLPNLPRPFGRIRTDEGGRAEFWLPAACAGLAWIPDPAHQASVTKVPPAGGEILLTWAPDPAPFLHVVDAFGREVSGARLTALPLASLAGPLSVIRVPPGAASAAADLRGRLPLPSSQAPRGGWIAAEGYALREIPALPRSSATIQLQPARDFPVRMVDASTGKPVGAVHWETSINPSQISWVTLDQTGVWEEGKGWLAPSSFPCALTLSKEGFVPKTLPLEGPPGAEGLKVALEGGIVIGGRILDPSGGPVADATVLAGDLRAPQARCKSTKDGNFRLPPLRRSEGPYSLLVKAEGFLDKTAGPLPAQSTSSVRIVLDRGGVVQGRVIDEETRLGVAGATVAFRALGGSSSQGVTCVR